MADSDPELLCALAPRNNLALRPSEMLAERCSGGRALFYSITSDDWKRALARDIQRTNSVAEQIRAAEIDILR